MNRQSKRLSDGSYIAKDYFVYELNFLDDLAPAGSTSGYITIDTDSDFFWQKACAHVTVGGASTTRDAEQIPEVDIQIKDSLSGRYLMNIQVPLRNIFGTGEIPFILPIEKYFGARAQIGVTIYNVSVGTTYSAVKLSFIGIKAFTN